MGGFPDGCRPARESWQPPGRCLAEGRICTMAPPYIQGGNQAHSAVFQKFLPWLFPAGCHDQACAYHASIKRSLHRQHPAHLLGEPKSMLTHT